MSAPPPSDGVEFAPDEDFLRALNEAPASEKRRRLVQWLGAEIVVFLGFEPDEVIDPTDEFFELGFDSLRAVDFKLRLEQRLSCELSSTLLFDCSTPELLADYLLTVLLSFRDVTDVVITPAHPLENGTEADPATLSREELVRLASEQAARLRALDDARHEPIAIVGMAGRFPGARDLEAFWRLQVEGLDAIGEVPAGRWPVDRFYDPDRSAPGKMYTRYGGFVEGVDLFDARFFGVSPREAAQLDPQQRILLELTWEALERGGITPEALRDGATGVFIGTRGADYFQGQTGWHPNDADTYYATGNSSSTMAGRLSYWLGLDGPCFALDTACSSSLVALHEACRSLREGESLTALAGGVNLVLDPFGTIAICKASMLSEDGRCKTFDARADGYVRSEGCGMLVLKRLSRARADGDRVFALVRGTSVNQDGASGGLTVPSTRAQERVIRGALADARVEPCEIDYVEAHGTGTSLGDPLEVAALDVVFGPGRSDALVVGSVKTNIGHAEPAAGIAGLLRTVLMLQHGSIPRLLHLGDRNPHIPWDETVIDVPTELRPWPERGGRRMAGINSFGFSGTNAHVVVEEAPDTASMPSSEPRAELLPLSAHSPDALRELAAAYRDRLTTADAPPAGNVCFTAGTGRAHFAHRAGIVGADAGELAERLEVLARDGAAPALGRASGSTPRIAFLYTGQGSQTPGMGRELFEGEPVFRSALLACAAELRRHLEVPLLDVLYGDRGELLDRTDYTQPALFALQYALGELWASWGVRPDWVLGHSIGEYAAAQRAGVFSFEDACALVAARGRLMVERTDPGAMAAVFADAEDLEVELRTHAGRLAIAAYNCDARVVLSGATELVHGVTEGLRQRGIRSEPLDVSHAFHSPLMEPMLEEFEAVAKRVRYHEPELGFVSNLDPGPAGGAIARAGYWVRHVREPVRFQEGMRALAGEGCDVLLEVGPAPVLLGMAKRFLDLPDAAWLPSMRPGHGERARMLESASDLYVRGVDLEWKELSAGVPRTRIDLPTYPFQRERYWIEAHAGSARGDDPDAHPLLGSPVSVAVLDRGEVLYESHLAQDSPSFLADHEVFGHVIVPGAAYVEWALAAGARTSSGATWEVSGLRIEAALELGEAELRVQLVLEPAQADGSRAFRVCSLGTDGSWTVHARGTLAQGQADTSGETVDVDSLHARVAGGIDIEEYYAALAGMGLCYGPAFRALAGLRVEEDEALAHVRLGEHSRADRFVVHPALLDACFQSCGVLAGDLDEDETYLPVGIEGFHCDGPLGDEVWCRARPRAGADEENSRVLAFDLELFDPRGIRMAAVRGLELLRTRRSALASSSDALALWSHEVKWQHAGAADGAGAIAAGGAWLVLADGGVLAAKLTALLEARGAVVLTVTRGEVPAGDPKAWGRVMERFRDAGPRRAVVNLWPLDTNALRESLELFQALASFPGGSSPRVWFVTRGAVAAAAGSERLALEGAGVHGLVATALLEHPTLRPACLDLDPVAEEDEAARLLEELAADPAETRIARRAGERRVPRLTRSSPARVERPASFALRTTEYGVLDKLAPVPTTRRAPGPGEVEVVVSAAALNFKDVLFALGLLRDFTGIDRALEQPLGLECAGRIARLGPGDAKGWQVSDEVVVAAPDCMASHVTVPAHALMRRPSGLTAVEAAALPTVFLTARHALLRCAKLAAGERVLIHAAAGGVGQAAIQVAQSVGAIVYATASPAKWSLLASQGVEHVFHSRTTDFAREIRELTNAAGVDVCLNSLGGETIRKSLEVLGENGRFVDIGKIDVWSAERVRELRPDVAYSTFDMAEVLGADTELFQSMLGDLSEAFALGEHRPIGVRSFPVREATSAFRELAQGRHVGKLVVDFGREAGFRVRGDASYLITGGTGALGLHIAAFLVERGASNLVLAARREPGESARAAIGALEENGAEVRVAALDVSDRGAVQDLVASLELPLAGVVHAAGLLEDGTLSNLTWERFERVLRPKVDGALHLHEATLSAPLDFFVCFSSMASMVGSTGQGAYSAANAVLDALAHDRRARGLPALTICWGPWSGGGMATESEEANRARFAELGLGSITPEQGCSAFERLLADPETPPVVGILPVDWNRYLSVFHGEAPPYFEALSEAGGGSGEDDRAILATLEGCAPEELYGLVLEFLRDQLARVMGYASGDEVDPGQSFLDMGIDSLLAVDLRNRLEATLEVEIPVTLVFDHPNLAALAELLVGQLAARREDGDDALLSEIEGLSDEEVERELATGGEDG